MGSYITCAHRSKHDGALVEPMVARPPQLTLLATAIYDAITAVCTCSRESSFSAGLEGPKGTEQKASPSMRRSVLLLVQHILCPACWARVGLCWRLAASLGAARHEAQGRRSQPSQDHAHLYGARAASIHRATCVSHELHALWLVPA
jgi:hypothetical protein